MRELREQLYMRWDEMLMVLGMEAVCFLFGEIILAIAVHVFGEKSGFQLGTMMTLFVAFFIMVFLGICVLPVHFSIAVCLGAVRKRFVPVFFAVSFFENAVAAGGSYLFFHLENWIFRTAYPGVDMEYGIEIVFQWKYILPACFAVTALNVFFGTFFLKYGKVALTAFWVLWMAVFVGGPRIIHLMESADNTVLRNAFGAFLDWFYGFTETSKLAAVVLVSAVLLVLSWLMLRKQQAEI